MYIMLFRIFFIIVCACGFSSRTGAFQFSPITETLRPAGSGSTKEFAAINDSKDPIAVEIKVMKREMTKSGEDVLTETEDEFSIFPLQTVVMGGNSKKVLVKWLGDPALDVEKAYRIIAEQVPVDLEKRNASSGAQVQVMLRYVGSLYVQPEKAKSNLEIRQARKGLSADGKKTVFLLTLENSGSRHTIVKDPILQIGNVELTSAELGGCAGSNVLAKTTRTFEIPIPAKLSSINSFKLADMQLKYRESD